MSAPESMLGPLRRKDGDPSFDEPWQAQALAMADSLVQSGLISAPDWARTLGLKLQDMNSEGAPDDTETYYRAVLAALEHLLDGNGAIPSRDLSARRDAWERSYLKTPHGKPVELDRDQ